MPAWDPQGIPAGDPWRAPAPASIVIDPSSGSWVLVQHATRNGADHVVAIRYGADGYRRTTTAIDLGAVPHVSVPSSRIEASLARAGVVRVDVAGKPIESRVEVTP